MQSETINELAAALAKAQGSMKPAVYNRINPHFKSRYADLAAVIDAIQQPLSQNGLSRTQEIEPINGMGIYLRTVIRHTSGQWISSMYPLPTDATPQQFGSALTYARRYSLSSIVGIASDDDDDATEAQKTPSSRNVMQAAQQKGGAAMAQKPLAQDLNDEIPADFIAVESGGEAPPVFVAANPPLKQKNFAAASSAEGAAAVAPSPATGGADLKLQLLYSVARAEAMKGDTALQAWFKTRTKEEKEELRKIKAELVALYPK